MQSILSKCVTLNQFNHIIDYSIALIWTGELDVMRNARLNVRMRLKKCIVSDASCLNTTQDGHSMSV